MGYAPVGLRETDRELLGSIWEVEIAGRRFRARASLEPLYDPKSERVRM
jgi:4-methylaminobutanoate oxidase (formaldehyde-forming)